MKNEEIKQTKIKLTISLLLCAALLGFIGITIAWFSNFQQLNTVSLVQNPSRITLSGANRSELQRISLELTADDTQNGDQVTIRRVFCIESTANFWLEVIRTTNIENMDIRIYPVQSSNSDQKSGTVKGTNGVETFYYTPDAAPLPGNYINLAEDDATAIQKNVSGTLHNENYNEDDAVQKNAEPLYWCINEQQVCDLKDYSKAEAPTGTGLITYYRYYVLELIWDTSAQETDMIYLLASH